MEENRPDKDSKLEIIEFLKERGEIGSSGEVIYSGGPVQFFSEFIDSKNLSPMVLDISVSGFNRLIKMGQISVKGELILYNN